MLGGGSCRIQIPPQGVLWGLFTGLKLGGYKMSQGARWGVRTRVGISFGEMTLAPKNQQNAMHQLEVQPGRRLQACEPAWPFQKESTRREQVKPQPKQLGPVNKVSFRLSTSVVCWS